MATTFENIQSGANKVTTEIIQTTSKVVESIPSKKQATSTLKNVGVATSSGILGTMHLVFDSLADGCLNAEAYLNNKIRGDEKEITIAKRQIQTEYKKLSVKKHVFRKDINLHDTNIIVDAFSKAAKKSMAEQQARILFMTAQGKFDVTNSALEVKSELVSSAIDQVNQINNI